MTLENDPDFYKRNYDLKGQFYFMERVQDFFLSELI